MPAKKRLKHLASPLALAATTAFVLPAWPKDTMVSTDTAGRLSMAGEAKPSARAAIGGTSFDCDSSMGVHLSADAGKSWATQCLPQVPMMFTIDSPSVAFDDSGAVVAVSTVVDERDYRYLFSAKSTDGGASWSPWVLVSTSERSSLSDSLLKIDDQPRSPFKGSLYVSHTITNNDPTTQQIFVARSRDGGLQWGVSGASPRVGEGVSIGYGDLAVARDGQVYLSYLTCDGFNCSGKPAKVQWVSSADGGATWGEPVDVAAVQQPGGAGFWGGLPGTSTSLSFTPAMAVDNTKGPHQGEIYLAMTTLTGGHLQVLTTRSKDGGAHWTTPQPVSTAAADQFLPAISMSPQGVLAVSWLDRRNDRSNLRYQPMVAFSTDGGRVFGAPIVLDRTLSDVTGHYNMEGAAGHAWVGGRLEMTYFGKDKTAATTVRASGTNP